jgi:hypothetical protein
LMGQSSNSDDHPFLFFASIDKKIISSNGNSPLP